MDNRFKEMTKRRDRLLIGFQISFILILIGVFVTNTLYVWKHKHIEKGADFKESGSAVMENLDVVRGNKYIFFGEFSLLFLYRIVTVLVLCIALWRYWQAHRYRKSNGREQEKGYSKV